MRFTSALLLAAVGVSAHPSGHAHMHRAVHEHNAAEKRDGTVVVATIDGKVVSWTQGGSPFKAAHKPTPAPAPTTLTTQTTAAAVPTVQAAAVKAPSPPAAASSPSAPSSGSSSGSSGTGITSYQPFGGCASKKRATAAQVAYQGNTGCNGYGSNILLVAEQSIASQYQYVVKAVSSGQALQCQIWNKIGPDGGINGFFTGNQAKTFNIEAGGSQYVVFDSNTQGGMCCSAGSVPTTSVGEFLCPWLEFDFADAANGGWSGFDASALVAGSAGGPFNALNVCTADGSVCSSLNAGGGGTNAYLPGDEAADGIGGNLGPGSVSLVATW